MKEGNEVQFISSISGYGVKSLIEKLIPYEFILFRQIEDTKENGDQEREKEWTGGMESYSLLEKSGVTMLTIELDVPTGQKETFKVRFPKALERIKILEEKKEWEFATKGETKIFISFIQTFWLNPTICSLLILN